jgi:hypothetical protein
MALRGSSSSEGCEVLAGGTEVRFVAQEVRGERGAQATHGVVQHANDMGQARRSHCAGPSFQLGFYV